MTNIDSTTQIWYLIKGTHKGMPNIMKHSSLYSILALPKFGFPLSEHYHSGSSSDNEQCGFKYYNSN